MSKRKTFSDFALAPDLKDWGGDERVQHEFYRASTIALSGLTFGCLIAAIIAGAMGEVAASVMIWLLPVVANAWVSRHMTHMGINYRAVTRQFPKRYRRTAALVIAPLTVLWLACYIWQVFVNDYPMGRLLLVVALYSAFAVVSAVYLRIDAAKVSNAGVLDETD